MTHHALAIAATVVGWWSLTGLLLVLDGRPARTFPATMLAASAVLAGAVALLVTSRFETTVLSAYASFAGGLLLWGYIEISFLLGFVTGPRREACPSGCGGWRHFVHAVEAILYHEIAIIAGAVLAVAICWGGVNAFGAFAYLLLWAMRVSAKLNLFLGVPNLGEEFLPPHLAYLASFFRRRPMNFLFPLSVTVPIPVAGWFIERAIAPGSPEFQTVGYTLLATLLVLGILEHWFLVLPLPSAALWRLRPANEARNEGETDCWGAAEYVPLPVDFVPDARVARGPASPAARRASCEPGRRARTAALVDPQRRGW
jgi:putative photosynthetic complex assembly protein 2